MRLLKLLVLLELESVANIMNMYGFEVFAGPLRRNFLSLVEKMRFNLRKSGRVRNNFLVTRDVICGPCTWALLI